MLTKDVKLATWRMNNAKATMLVIVLSLAKTWRLSIPKDVTAPQLMPCPPPPPTVALPPSGHLSRQLSTLL